MFGAAASVSAFAAGPQSQESSAEQKSGSSSHKGKDKPYSLIFGTVWDAQNRAVPGVKVKIQREGDKKPKWELVSDARGEFAQRLPAGTANYLVWAEVKRNKGPAAKAKVHIDNDERQDIGLHISE